MRIALLADIYPHTNKGASFGDVVNFAVSKANLGYGP